MKQILSLLAMLTIITLSSSFAPSKNNYKHFTGKWKLVEITRYTYLSNNTHKQITTSVTNGNIKEFDETLSFNVSNHIGSNIIQGSYSLNENKLVEVIEKDSKNLYTGKIHVIFYHLENNKLILEYPGKDTNQMVKEVWKKVN